MLAGGKGAAALVAWGSPAVYHAVGLLGFLVAALLVSTNVWLFVSGARRRAAARAEGFGVALWSILTKARTQSGGYLAHIGMGIILVGLVGSSMYVLDTSVFIDDQVGTSFTVSDYEFIYQGTSENVLANGDNISAASFQVERDGEDVGMVSPGLTRFALQGQTNLHAAVLAEPLRDIFMVWEGSTGGQLSVNVKVNPLIGFVWTGFALLLAGTTLAAWPKAQRVARSRNTESNCEPRAVSASRSTRHSTKTS
jgi:cytochrome c-type biogenesis protein CcmF